MSPGSSSPRDLNIAPTRRYCCHSRTYGDLLTLAVQKRLQADISTPNVVHKKSHPCFPGFEGSGCSLTHASSAFSPFLAAEDGVNASGGRWTTSPIGQTVRVWTADPQAGVRVCHNSQGHLPVPGPRLDAPALQAAARPRVGGV